MDSLTLRDLFGAVGGVMVTVVPQEVTDPIPSKSVAEKATSIN